MRLKETIIGIVLIFHAILLGAQPKKIVKEDATTAIVNVVMSNSKQVPQKGEQIIFVASKTNKSYVSTTDAHGKLTLHLPPGDEYTLKLKSLQDTTKYSTMAIPALEKGQYFTDPFLVTIVYDPPVSFTLDNVQFDINKATLRPASYKELDELANYMRWKDDQAIEIAGHTDNDGRPADNMRLSQQRAETVKAYLIKKGISATKVTAKGYGDTQPVADNHTADGRQKNRRTEARLKESGL